jgi:hypothetical protein
MKKLSPVLIVNEIEPCLSFWMERLGFTMITDVQEGDRYAFVLLAKDEVQIMVQTAKSAAGDIPQLDVRDKTSFLYLDVDDIDAVERALGGVPLVQPRRTTFYGATEIGVREPGGSFVLFAQHDAPTSAP